ncbi:MAG: hypothetical protein KBD78_03810 [Oligoflexales bacterium]|nr:hypothetical protein [Oligoflexales bacterium]
MKIKVWENLSFVMAFGFLLYHSGSATPIKYNQIIENFKGDKIEVLEKGFSIVPPKNWIVSRKPYGMSLLMHPAKKDKTSQGDQFLKSIQVYTFNEPAYIDEDGANKHKAWLEETVRSRYPELKHFRFLDDYKVSTKMDRPALMFYVEFELNNVNLMQAQILVSSQTRHYQLVYTDLAENFFGSQRTELLDTAWKSMTSIELDSPSPGRYDTAFKFIFPLLGLILVGLLVNLGLRQKAQRRYATFEREAKMIKSVQLDEPDELKLKSRYSEVSELPEVPPFKSQVYERSAAPSTQQDSDNDEKSGSAHSDNVFPLRKTDVQVSKFESAHDASDFVDASLHAEELGTQHEEEKNTEDQEDDNEPLKRFQDAG